MNNLPPCYFVGTARMGDTSIGVEFNIPAGGIDSADLDFDLDAYVSLEDEFGGDNEWILDEFAESRD